MVAGWIEKILYIYIRKDNLFTKDGLLSPVNEMAASGRCPLKRSKAVNCIIEFMYRIYMKLNSYRFKITK